MSSLQQKLQLDFVKHAYFKLNWLIECKLLRGRAMIFKHLISVILAVYISDNEILNIDRQKLS